MKASFEGTVSVSVLTFSRDLIPGLQITLLSVLSGVDFKPLEDFLAELVSETPTFKVLPLGSVVELIRVLSRQA